MLSQPSEAARAAEAWERFSAAWPFDPVPYRRAAAEAAFAELTREEREAAIRCARTFVKAWRTGGRSGLPDARNWIRERGWKACALTPSSAPPAALPAAQSGARLMAARLPDGSYRLHPDSPQLQRWKEHERRALGRARLGIVRPSEWPPDIAAAAGVCTASRAPPRAGDSSRRPTR
jgi:hypothetical protein